MKPTTAAALFVKLRDDPDDFQWRMGVRPLELGEWILIDSGYEDDLAEVDRLLRARREEIVLSEPGSRPAALEVYEAIAGHIAALDADKFGEVAPTTGDEHPLEAARVLVQEDLGVLERRPNGWVLTATAIAAPTAWNVPSKLGLNLDEIHAPVPRYDIDLSDRMNKFFDRMTVDRPVWRSNWTVTDDQSLRLDVPVRTAPMDPTIDISNVGERTWLRVEYQTLRRMPDSDAILFTIRIIRQELASVAEEPEALAELVRRLRQIPADVAEYKHSSVLYVDLIEAWASANGRLS